MTIPKTLRPLRWRLKTPERRLILFLGDMAVAWLGLSIGLYFWSQRDQWLNFSWQFLMERPPAWFFWLPVAWLLLIIELYDVRKASRFNETVRGVGIAAAISFLLYIVVFFFSDPNSLPRTGVAVFLIAVSLLTILWRLLYINIFTAKQFMRRVIIVGAGRAGTNLVHALHSVKPMPFHIVGFVDDDDDKQGKVMENVPVIGTGTDLPGLLEEENISDLIFAISGEMNPVLFQNLLKAEEKGVEINLPLFTLA